MEKQMSATLTHILSAFSAYHIDGECFVAFPRTASKTGAVDKIQLHGAMHAKSEPECAAVSYGAKLEKGFCFTAEDAAQPAVSEKLMEAMACNLRAQIIKDIKDKFTTILAPLPPRAKPLEQNPANSLPLRGRGVS